MLQELFLLSFPVVLVFVFPMWWEIRRRPEFGKRPKTLALAMLAFAAAGGVAAALYFELIPHTQLVLLSAAGWMIALYLAAVLLLEYSIHRQRIRDSFFTDDLSAQLRKMSPAVLLLTGSSLLLLVLAVMEALLEAEFGGYLFGFPLIGILIGAVLAATLGITDLFDFQAGVVRRKRYPFIWFGLSALMVVPLAGTGQADFYVLFVLLQLSFALRVYQEYFFARFIHLNDLFARLQDTIRVRNELVDKIIHSPLQDDYKVVQGMFMDSLAAAQAEAVLPQYGITGAAIYRRVGDELIIEHTEYTYGYCTPLYELDTVRKMSREQLVQKLVEDRFHMRKLLTHAETDTRQFGRSYLRSMIESKQPVKIQNIPDCYKGIIDLMVLYPVVDQDIVTGCIVIFKDSFHDVFPQEDKSLRTFANNLSTVFNIMVGKQMQEERNRLQGEMDIATNIQTSILPKEFAIPGFEIAASMETATEVGGDVYDWVAAENGNYLAIGDVSGHGLPSGIMALIQTAAFHGAVRAARHQQRELSPAELYNIVNQVLCTINRDRIGADKFMTGNYFYQQDGRFTHAGAHEIALLYSASEGTVREIQDTVRKTGYLGISEYVDGATSAGEFEMSAGDVLVLYTDGIIEAMDGKDQQFGIPRMGQVLQQYGSSTPAEIVQALRDEVRSFAENGDLSRHNGRFADDITMMVIKRTGN
ncbi:PP2C family protein-serine/threonine phosphatase [Spirochaeta africana]|uniref:Serine phosphatase RsbU, regulator of sigma subunit n=1 Tax=Spirochaeta africana (strain ATCC 700263 / DSM 8902 / Z-7692) TaxID=889378 RepID=H9UFC3_SPIAZ|nr:SpoIIE family protein phosphatase [Spirochaeta africana]AFG36216.1 serine phosphatase RsbU, regulator of sigma subunit [Spirochaeta africana DSM 8902]